MRLPGYTLIVLCGRPCLPALATLFSSEEGHHRPWHALWRKSPGSIGAGSGHAPRDDTAADGLTRAKSTFATTTVTQGGRGHIVYQPVIFQGALPTDEKSAAALFTRSHIPRADSRRCPKGCVAAAPRLAPSFLTINVMEHRARATTFSD